MPFLRAAWVGRVRRLNCLSTRRDFSFFCRAVRTAKLSALFLREQIEPSPLPLPIGHHFQLKDCPTGSTNRAGEFVLFPTREIAAGDPSIRYKAALRTMGHRRGKQTAWTNELAEVCQDTTCDRFRKMHQRSGSPKPIERHRMKGEISEISANQRQ